MPTYQRIAIALGALLLLCGALATFLPTSPEGATCGTWVAPEWTDEDMQDVADAAEVGEDLAALNIDGSLDGQLSDLSGAAYAAVASKRLCDDALGTRRTVSIVLLILGVVAPAGVLFIAGARRDDA